MEELKHSKTSSKTQSGLLSLIIDKNGKIIAFNPDIKKIIPNTAPQKNFFDLFDEETLVSVQRIFLDARKYEVAARDIVDVKLGETNVSYEFIFTPLRSESNVYFYVNISPLEQKKSEGEVKKFFIAASELEKITSDKKIHSLINKIKLTYPFTFIEKAKIQKEINELDEFFWMKDPTGKFILVNEKYAASLGFTSAQLENRKEEDFLPKYLIPLYLTVNNYINESTNVVMLEGISTPVSSGLSKGIQIIQFPICDLENKVVAIIGFSQKGETFKESKKDEINLEYIKQFPEAVAFLNRDNKVAALSNNFVEIMQLNEKIDYINKDLDQIFPIWQGKKEFIKKIEDYILDSSQKSPLTFSYNFSDKENLQIEVNVRKVFDTEGYLGSLILLVKKSGVDAQVESKSYLYDSLLQSIPEAMYIYDLDNLKFLEVNDAALKLYGYKRSEFLNMDLTDLYAPEDIQTLIQSSESKTSIELAGPWRHKKSDGTSVLVHIDRISIDFKGKKAHLNIVRNVTDEINEKKKIQLFQNVYEHTSDLIIYTDRDGFIHEINENITKKLGYSKKELESRSLISLVSDNDRAKISKNIFHSGLLKTVNLEVDIKKQSGNFQKANIVATPIKNYGGEIEGFSIIIKLIEEKSLAEEIKHTQEEVSNIDSSFLSNMFHEILTPLNVILGFTQELWESINSPSEEQKEAVNIIQENQKLLMQIMDNAVEYSALLQKTIKFKPEQIRFIDILEELKENIRKTAESLKIELTYGKISSSLQFETDKQKFISLISLLIKFALNITKENTLYISAYNKDENNFIVAVRDRKNSITPQLLKGFTDVLSDEETFSRRNYGFSRFSMRLAKKLIELLSAAKEVVKKDNEAYEFGLVFPNKFVVRKEANIEVESIQPVETKVTATAQTPEKIVPTLSGPRIKELDLSQLSCLYLEDQIDSQILFKSQMKELKNIEIAPSLEAALPLLKTKKFDFLIIDINLQGEYNGLDALRIIQKIPGYKDVPMIASTAYMQPGARENFIAAGFTDFISKPLLRDKIIDILKRIYSIQ